MIRLKKQGASGPSAAALARALREFGPWIAAQLPLPKPRLDETGVEDLDDTLRRDVGLPPRTHKRRPWPEQYKPPPFF
ncbi:MAG: hypothetical protein AAGA71_13910 [Pseudomonadota bacterium]